MTGYRKWLPAPPSDFLNSIVSLSGHVAGGRPGSADPCRQSHLETNGLPFIYRALQSLLVFDDIADLIVPFSAPPRNPPYDDALSERIAAAGFQDASVFVPSDIDGQPFGIYYAFVLIPDPGETGSSRDFASGPIIPNRLFPISDDTDVLRNGVVVDGELDGQFPLPPVLLERAMMRLCFATMPCFFLREQN